MNSHTQKKQFVVAKNVIHLLQIHPVGNMSESTAYPPPLPFHTPPTVPSPSLCPLPFSSKYHLKYFLTSRLASSINVAIVALGSSN